MIKPNNPGGGYLGPTGKDMFMEKKPYAALVPLFVAALAASAALALFLKPLWVGPLSAALVVACFGIGMVII